MASYDEDLSENPFFQTFLRAHVDLFSQCVCEKWLICVPRKDSLPKHAFTLEDFTHHILKPLRTSVEMKSRSISGESLGSSISNWSSFQDISQESTTSSCTNLSTSTNISNAPRTSPTRKWNFRTLTDVKLEYVENKLFFNVESPRNYNFVLNNFSKTGHPRSISVLFEETYYTTDKQKYKVLCIASPLNSKVEDLDTICGDADEDHFQNGNALWNLTSLRDCIDFIWLNGKVRALENFDAYIKLFLHNHQSLVDLPLAVQRDLVFDLYKKCLAFAVKSATASLTRSSSSNSKLNVSSAISDNSTSSETGQSMQNFKLATETYVLTGIYRQLINAITSALSFEDANLNKVVRNLAEIHPQDLDISSDHWENLTRAKTELKKLNLYASPLAKLMCLQKTMRHLRRDRPGPDELYSRDFENRGALSTDELLPLWVYLLIKTPLGNWMAQLQFFKQFRFSANNTPDNENSFLIVTLEASLAHLNAGKINGMSEAEVNVGMTCEIGDMWLRNLSSFSKDGSESPLAELFNTIRQGSFCKLEELANAFETKRNELKCGVRNGTEPQLCHPLCGCENCIAVTGAELETKSIFELTNEDGLSLIHVACVYGRPKIVDFVLGNGSPFASVDSEGMTPLHYAAHRGHQNALLLVLHAGAELDPLDNNLNTPLHHASMNGHEACVKALIYYGEHSRQSVGLSARNINGDTALHFASRFGFQGIVQILVEIGASITVTNAKQASAMDCAHDVHIVRILQRSLRRRSLIHTNHGDFVNIDVIKKDESDRVVMLITEPGKSDNPEAESNSPSNSAKGSLTDSRRSSVASQDVAVSRVKRDAGNGVVNHNLYGAKLVGHNHRRTSASNSTYDPDSLQMDNNDDIISVNTDFHVPTPLPKSCSEPEHLRSVMVENLDTSPSILASKAVTGLKRKRDAKEQGLRKLFSAITVGDIPLALFYLGISAEELEHVDDYIPGDLAESVPCHPLCSCNRCSAKNSGLDFSINVRNQEGLTPLHLAVQYNIHPLVKILLKYGANVKLFSTREHKTALQFAKEKYHSDIATTLEEWEVAGIPSFM